MQAQTIGVKTEQLPLECVTQFAVDVADERERASVIASLCHLPAVPRAIVFASDVRAFWVSAPSERCKCRRSRLLR